MADIESNIDININADQAISAIKQLQAQLSKFYQDMSKTSAKAAAEATLLQNKLISSINATGKFSASMQNVTTTTESFTTALEKNKLSMGEYFRYGASQVTGFRKVFSTEFDTIDKVARERVKTLQTQYVKLGRDANGAMKAIAVRPLKLDMNDLGTQVAMTAQKQQVFNELLKQGSTNLLNFGKNTQWAGRQLMVGFTIPLSIFGAAAAREFMKLEEQTIRFQKVYGDFSTSAEATDKMTDSIKNLSLEFTKYGIAVDKTIGLAADAAAMGKTGADLVAQVSEATRLAVLGGVEQSKALETTTSLTNAFGVASDKLSGKINFLNAVENQTVTSIEDLTEAIPKAGPVVEQLGGNVEDLAFFMTAMKEGGIDAGEGANALKSGLASMINPTQEATDRLAEFGINLKGIVDSNAGNVKNMIMALATELDNLSDINRAQAIEQLFGKFQFARMSTLFQNVIAEGSQAQRVLQLTQATTEELAVLSERELKKIESSPMYQFQAAVEKFQAALAPIGETFLKAVTPIINFGTDILNKFNEMGEGAKQFWTVVIAAVAGLGPVLLMTFGLIANGAANILKLFGMMGGVFTSLSGQSKLLGGSTQYMTNEQLESAAIAASLNQVHQDLIQTFTVETSALHSLTAAYQKAAAASGAITAAPMPRTRTGKVKKMATGGMVPGSGNGDTVPALLTPGEFVLTKDVVKAYPKLISGMMDGTVARFSTGGIVKKYSAPAEIRKQTNGMTWDTKEAEFAAIRQFAEENGLEQSVASELLRLNASHIKPGNEGSVKENGITAMFKKWFAKNLVPDLSAVNQYLNSLQMTNGLLDDFIGNQEFINKVAKKYGISSEEVVKELDNFKKGIHPVTKNGQSILYEVAKKDYEDARAKGPVKRGRATQAGATAAGLGVRLQQDSEWFDTNTGRYNPKSDSKANAQAERAARTAARNADTGAATTKKAEDKSKVAVKQKQANEAKAQTAVQQKALAEAEARFIANHPGFEKEYEDAKGDRATRTRLTKEKNKWISDQLVTIQEERKQKNIERGKKAAETRRANKAAADAAEAEIDASNQKSEQADLNMKEYKRQRRAQIAGKIAGVGVAASVALGATSMIPGIVGEVSQQLLPVAGIAATILPTLVSLGPVVGGVVGALAAATAGIFLFNNGLSDARKKSIELVDSLGSGTKAVEKLAEFAGNATAGQIMDKRRENQFAAFQVQEGKTTFGDSYLQSDAGKKMLDSVKSALKSGDMQNVQDMMINQMATAVSSGALSAGQARSIVAELAQELGDYNFGIKVNGKLLDLIGPNGENLLTDPIGVRVKMMQDTRNRVSSSATDFSRQNSISGPNAGLGIAEAGIGGAVGALAGGAVGAGLATGITAGASTGLVAGPVGALIGGILGAAGGAFIAADALTKLESAAGLSTAQGVMAMQQQQEILDSLQLEYEKRIANAKAAGDVAEAERLTTEYLDGRKDLIAEGKKTVDTLVSSYNNADDFGKGALGRNLDTAIESMAPDNALLQQMYNGAKDAIINASALSQKQEYQMKLYLASGNIDPQTMASIMTQFGNEDKSMNAVMNVMTNLGTADGSRALQIMNMFQDPEGNPLPDLQRRFIGQVSARGVEGGERYLDIFTEVQKVGEVVDLTATLEFYMNDPAAGEEMLSQVEKFREATKDGPVGIDVVMNVYGEEVAAVVAGNIDYFNSLDKDMQVTYTQTIKTIYQTIGTKDFDSGFNAWLASSGKKQANGKNYKYNTANGMGKNEAKLANEYIENQAWKLTEAAKAQANAGGDFTKEEQGGGGGGGGRQSSVLDDLLQKLRKVQMATLALTEGWAGARTALDNLFPGGASNSPFQGIEQQMRRLGAKEDLITMIAGMDPEEFQKRKDELFTFDGAGNIVGFRNSLLSIGAALRSIAFGEFQSEQQKNINVLRDQNDAIRKLIANGFSMADAFEMVKNSAFASAIAQETNNDIIKQSTESYKEATKQAKIFAAAQAAATANETAADNSGMLAFINANTGNLSNAVIEEMLKNKEFATLLMSPTLSAEQKAALQQWINNIENNASIELSTNLTNITGMEKVFQDGFNKAMEAFSAQEKRIELEFAVKKDPFQKTVENAQNLISDIQNKPGGLDDLQADLERISDQEQDINKRYKDRMDALEQIKRSNDRIIQQRKAELTVADAITQGDIAAAAKAIEDARAQQAQANMQAQQEMLQRQQQAEVDALTGQMGMTREQIEMRVRDIKNEILHIEESMLEPAQYQLSLLERQEKRQKESLTVLGMTRREWETIKNRIDVAKTSSEEYKTAMEAARDVVNKIVEYWTEIQKPKTTVHTIITVYQTQGTPGTENIGPSGDPTSGGNPAGGNRETGIPSNGVPSSPIGSTGLSGTYSSYIKSSPLYSRYKGLVQAYGSGSNAAKDIKPAFDSWVTAMNGRRVDSIDRTAAALSNKYKSWVSLGYSFNSGGMVPGIGDKDTISSMLTPGEFVMTKPAVAKYGARMMKDINNGTFNSGSVYNYSVSVNVETGADAEQIANTVMRKIKSVDAKRIQGNRF